MAVTIRPATAADREFVVGLASRLANFEPAPWRTREELVAGDRRALEGWFDEPAAGEAMLVAELDGEPCGCAYLVTTFDYFSGRQHAHLSVLAVSGDAEGRGVGTALLDACDAWAKQHGADRITLHVMANNTRARALYERRGFAPEYLRYVKPLG
jgi:ribosomal protein S18 acetylase RimI-like enzyme